MIQKTTRDGEDLFILGGIDHKHRSGCTNVASISNCSIPIRSHQVGTTGHYVAFHSWQVGDSYLDWYGKEPGQGSYRGKEAEGTPAVWTTNNRNHAGYLDLNTYGDHNWLIDFDNGCTKTKKGWFQLKAVINTDWESNQMFSTCSGIMELFHIVLEITVQDLEPRTCIILEAAYTDPHCNGKQAIVHLFEWKWTDIADECERFLSKKGYCGVQVSPANEHTVITKDYPRPWWERYQPVSYKLTSRSGNEQQFKDMVTRCKAVGVRIIVDVVVNHMTGLGRKGTGSGGTSFDADNYDFPGVPYRREHFNSRSKCPSGSGGVDNYGDPNNVRNCFLVGLTDLDQSQEYVRDKIAGYFNHLIDIGVSGFRVDASKHMWPGDLKAIEDRTKDLPEGGRPIFFHEVIDQNDGAVKVTEYTSLGYVTEFRYCQKIAWVMSSYYFGDDSSQGPPHNADFSAKDVTIEADGSCGNGWVCEHRWKPIANMIAFRNAVAGTSLNNWRNQNDEVSFSRGNKGFFAMAKQGHMNARLQTGLPAGQYCDLISDCQKKITVDSSGMAQIVIDNNEDPIVAFITDGPSQPSGTGGTSGSSSGSGTGSISSESGTTSPGTGSGTTLPPATLGPAPTGWSRTVILIEKHTQTGQDLFIRGGIDHAHRQGCSNDASTSNCAIPIRNHKIGTGAHYAGFHAWQVGDTHLDWYGAEQGQGSYHGKTAQGTPAVWTTNKPNHAGYSDLNTYGDHYWLIDFDVDCSKTENGWFELKAVVNTDWENNVRSSSCSGISGNVPYSSGNHWARCGAKNVFHFGSSTCEISAYLN
ncbi:hypothetical protein KUTeg_024836, partial [Tegillarca granosa]